MTVEIIVDNTCTGCGRCKKVCPKGPVIWDIRIRKDGNPKYFAANPDSCLFCKFCVGVCPVMAITVQNRGTSVSTSNQREKMIATKNTEITEDFFSVISVLSVADKYKQ